MPEEHDEYADYERRVEVSTRVPGTKEYEVRVGKVFRTLRNQHGMPVYEVDFGSGPQRIPSRDTVIVLGDKAK